MNKVIKIFNRLVILILIILFILFGSAITLIKKPDLGIRLYNNFFSENIFLEFSNLVNNGTFISPSYEVNEFKVIINEKDYLTLSNLEFGINLIKSLSSKTLIITEFALSDIKISDADLDSRNNTNISNEASFIIDGRNLNVLGFSSKTFEIKATPSLVSAVFYGGAISDLSFLSLKINSRDNYQTWSYKSEHNFGNDLVDLSGNSLFLPLYTSTINNQWIYTQLVLFSNNTLDIIVDFDGNPIDGLEISTETLSSQILDPSSNTIVDSSGIRQISYFGNTIFKNYINEQLTICAEANIEPINKQSLKFHEKMGFRRVEDHFFSNKYGVAYLEKNF